MSANRRSPQPFRRPATDHLALPPSQEPDPAKQFCDEVLRPFLDSSSETPVDLEKLMLFVDDELQQARRQSAQNHLPTDEFRKISMLVMSDRAWARVHSELLTKRLASEAT